MTDDMTQTTDQEVAGDQQPAYSLPDDYTPQKRTATERRFQQATELLRDKKHVLILLHNDPDPDAIASGWAMEQLLHHALPKVKLTLGHGGLIGRAENRTMVELFTPHVKYIARSEVTETLAQFDAIVMVDTQPAAGNHLLYGLDYPPENIVFAIDHHPPRRSQTRALVHDVRPEVGACATILSEYLAATDFTPSAALATALFYGVKSDTRGLSRHATPLDSWAYMVLRNLVDIDLLNKIEQVRLPRSYFRSLSDALANTTIYHCPTANGKTSQTMDESAPEPDKPDSRADDDPDHPSAGMTPATGKKANGSKESEEEGIPPCVGDVTVSLLFNMTRPDMAAEVADLMLRLENVSWAICLGIFEDRIVISVRTDVSDARAGRLVRSIVGRNGTAGGHDTMAGGRVHLPDATPAERVASLHTLVPRFLRELGVADAHGDPLLKSAD
jgi:nanoRNase/pAp phosphatase (c-di-AMP/oligoRNAs hydrolase)